MKGKTAHITAVAGAAMLWSTSFAVTKVVLPHVGELALGAIRFLLAALLLLPICLLTKQTLRAPLADHRQAAVAGLTGITLYFTLENYGVAFATATDATLIVATYPVLTMVAAGILHRQAPALINILGALVAFAGVAVVVSQSPVSAAATNRELGIFLLLCGGLAWTAYNLIAAANSQQTKPQLSVVPTTLLQNFWGGCGFLALLLIAPTQHTLTLTWNSQAWLPIAYLALGCSALAFLLYTFGLTRLGPGQAVGILNLVPIFGVLWAAVIAGEQLTIHTIAGAAVIVAGVAMSATTPRRGRHVAPRALKNPRPVLSRPSRITDGVSS